MVKVQLPLQHENREDSSEDHHRPPQHLVYTGISTHGGTALNLLTENDEEPNLAIVPFA